MAFIVPFHGFKITFKVEPETLNISFMLQFKVSKESLTYLDSVRH